jgi:glycosyltransferase involved in cell wall biosynthesis
MVYWAGLGSRPATIWLKYLGQAISTWRILIRERPDAVFVMSPPVVAGLVVFPYCAMRGIPLVVDAHTGAFLNPRWRRFTGLQYWLCRRAATTIVTNAHLEAMLTAHGADVIVLPDVPVKYPEGGASSAKNGFSVAVICSLDRDEPIDVILNSVRALPDVSFFMTGDRRKIERLYPDLPSNLFLTGFLDNTAYGQLLRDAGAVMALTTGSHTMLRAAYEAIYQDTPIIISQSPTLREEFPIGGVLVDHSAEMIAAAVREIQGNQERYRREARELRMRKEERWEKKKELLIRKIAKGAAFKAAARD